jgi:hypothetical protein
MLRRREHRKVKFGSVSERCTQKCENRLLWRTRKTSTRRGRGRHTTTRTRKRHSGWRQSRNGRTRSGRKRKRRYDSRNRHAGRKWLHDSRSRAADTAHRPRETNRSCDSTRNAGRREAPTCSSSRSWTKRQARQRNAWQTLLLKQCLGIANAKIVH